MGRGTILLRASLCVLEGEPWPPLTTRPTADGLSPTHHAEGTLNKERGGFSLCTYVCMYPKNPQPLFDAKVPSVPAPRWWRRRPRSAQVHVVPQGLHEVPRVRGFASRARPVSTSARKGIRRHHPPGVVGPRGPLRVWSHEGVDHLLHHRAAVAPAAAVQAHHRPAVARSARLTKHGAGTRCGGEKGEERRWEEGEKEEGMKKRRDGRMENF